MAIIQQAWCHGVPLPTLGVQICRRWHWHGTLNDIWSSWAFGRGFLRNTEFGLVLQESHITSSVQEIWFFFLLVLLVEGSLDCPGSAYSSNKKLSKKERRLFIAGQDSWGTKGQKLRVYDFKGYVTGRSWIFLFLWLSVFTDCCNSVF